MNIPIIHCSTCGSKVNTEIPPGDHRPRQVCPSCGQVHYLNPKLVVGSLPVWEDKVLLCRRAIEPRLGFWTLPAGFMEADETLAEAACRETFEEACANIELQGLYTLVNIPHINQVHVIYRARLLDTGFHPGEESLETRLFSEQEIPWDEIAFRSISLSLRNFFEDRRRGSFTQREETLLPGTAHLP
ncbi:NUDIX hydrolase [Uliginosibacterium sp. TH139]|nr:NUDIX hydrolase [Uliginosibacterium sp. TH139]